MSEIESGSIEKLVWEVTLVPDSVSKVVNVGREEQQGLRILAGEGSIDIGDAPDQTLYTGDVLTTGSNVSYQLKAGPNGLVCEVTSEHI